ncbi:MAG TPA: [acyl-carrier-protein] S-malonyltransferase, partial [Lachnoclostridium sp.]|nr:[acyl-carrier-protein] S-malonyltransferase [Lachnoclostridium sp.]
LLKEQVYSSVRWQQSVETMVADGVDTFIEIGPGKTLAGFIKKITKDARVFNIEKLEDMEKLINFS